MLQMTFHVYQITREVIRITKIYSLLCVGCMVKGNLTKGQVGSSFQQHPISMNDMSNNLSLHIPKKCTFKLLKHFTFEIGQFV